jgi:hypothetical protein
MSKTKSITELITELQEENNQAKFFYKQFEQAVKHEFNYSVNELHEIILKYKAYERKYANREALSAEKAGQ